MKKKLTTFIIIFICILIIGTLFENMKPKNLKDEFFYYINPVESTEYIGGIHKIGNKSVYIYSFLNKDEYDSNTYSFTVTIAQVEGLLNNRHNIYVYAPQDNELILNTSYSNIISSPQYEIKQNNNYLGFVYFGIVPPDCCELKIDGVKADLKPYSITLNGTDTEFVLYSCFIEKNTYPQNVKIEYTTSSQNGKSPS